MSGRKTSFTTMLVIATLFAAMGLAGCSTQKNTAQSRWWHAFNARYNTYYNGKVAYIDASLEKEEGNQDNFTELIPFYTVSNKNSKEIGKANYERAIEKSEKAIHQHSIKRRPVWDKNRRKTTKDREWLSRREYNPFIWKAWMLMGRAQFFEGNFNEAASTFSYMSRLFATQPAIYDKAQAWLAKCYIEQGWTYDAEDVIRNIERDTLHWSAQREWDNTYALYYIHTQQYARAIPYLRKAISHEMRRKQKARLWYLMGQVQASLDNEQDAYKAFRHVIALNPPYELEFNARVSLTEVMGRQESNKMKGKLKRMAASDKNQQYLEQVYYALGNIYMTKRDTLQAIAAYEKGAQKSIRNGIEKGVLLMRLGDIYWQREKFSDASRCYGEAIGLLDKDRKDYAQLAERSKILEELTPYTETIELQDSLQRLAQMSEADRNAAIDKIIEEVKRKEKEERKMLEEMESNSRQGDMGYANQGKASDQGRINQSNRQQNHQSNTPQNSPSTGNTWYFYSPLSVAQGKQQFQKLWGKRENVDNWQRSNKTVVSDISDFSDLEDSAEEITADIEQDIPKDKKEKRGKGKDENPAHQRSYYLDQIPLTPQQMAESNRLLEDALLHAGIIMKDKMDELSLSEKTLRRLIDHYPDYEHLDDAYYHLYLLYQIKRQPAQASLYLDQLKQDYPESQWTVLLTSPYYEEDAKMGVHIEDSLYTATYEAFRREEYNQVIANAEFSGKRFPEGANRDKFLFIGGMSKLGEGHVAECLDDMKMVLEKYPESRLSEMAGMIVNGVKAGRRLHGGKFDLSDVWSRRDIVLNEDETQQQYTLSEDRNEPFTFVLAYIPDSVNENQLLFEMAKYNFTSYLVRNFDINIDAQGGLHRMLIKGFHNYDEARQYANSVYQQQAITRLLPHVRSLIISEKNFPLLGTRLSYDDYALFYQEHLAPLKVSKLPLLQEPEGIVMPKDEGGEIQEKTKDKETSDDTDFEFDDPDGSILDDEYYELEGF